jgi:glycosyltransferase involved in cell wall biosynthesis
MKRTKVVHVIQTLNVQGGLQRVVTNLCKLLADSFDVEIWVFSNEQETFFSIDNRVKLRNIGDNPDVFDGKGLQKGIYFLSKLFSGIINYRKLIKLHQPDLIFIHRSEIDDVFMGFQRFYSGSMEVLHTPYKMKRQKALSKITIIQRKFFYQFFQPKKNVVVPNNGVKIDMESDGWRNVNYIPNFIGFTCNKKAERTNKTIIAVGRNSPEKGFDLLMNSFKRLVEIYPDWELHFLGSDLDSLKTCSVKNVNISPPVKNLEDVIAFYNSASIFVLPSYYESMPLVLLEAMECGLPVVASKIKGLEQIAKKDCVLLFENGSEDDLVAKLELMINHPDLQNKFIANAAQHVQGFYPENVITKWDALINKILA